MTGQSRPAAAARFSRTGRAIRPRLPVHEVLLFGDHDLAALADLGAHGDEVQRPGPALLARRAGLPGPPGGLGPDPQRAVPPDPAAGEHPAQAGPGGTGMPPRGWCPSGPSASCGGRSSRYTQCHSSGSSSPGRRYAEQPGQRLRRARRDQLGDLVDVIQLGLDDLAELDGPVAQQRPDLRHRDALEVRAGLVRLERVGAGVPLVQHERVRILRAAQRHEVKVARLGPGGRGVPGQQRRNLVALAFHRLVVHHEGDLGRAHPRVNGSRVPPVSSTQMALVAVYSCTASMPFSRPSPHSP